MTTRLLKSLACIILLALLLVPAAAAQPGVISTVAGTGTSSPFNGDGIPATAARLVPTAVFVDGSGNIFIADAFDNRIRKVDGATGLISTVAGIGGVIGGFNGDGIPATTAQLLRPRGVFVDGSGNIFIADASNHRIRKVDGATGLISTVAGTGTVGFNGDGIPATTAQLRTPSGVFVDGSGNVFIADVGSNRIRKVDGVTGLISTVAGTGAFGYNGDGIPATTAHLRNPPGVVVDGSGNIFILDRFNYRIRKVDGATGLISTVAGTGAIGYNGDGIPATTAWLSRPAGVFVDGAGNVFIADTNSNRIRKVGAAVTNQPPVADAGGPYEGDEGAAIALSGATASDPDGDPLTLSWSVDTSPTSATCTFSDDSVLNPDLTCDDNSTFTVTLTADDGTAAPVSSDATVTVDNVAPDVSAVTVPTDPIDINDQPVTGVSADFSDPGTNDTHTCTVDYDDGTGPQVGTISSATCEGPDQTYADPGVYEVPVEVTDDDGGIGSATATTFIVIYDPDGGFVTGGGWIDSPDGACPTFCDNATGTANFGFVSKYRRGASVPDGQTEFNFTAGDLNFHSTSYDWLVIAGAKAMYKGEGTVNGDAGFTFQINAIDGSLPGGGGVDKFRIKIKEPGGGMIYDNQMGAGDNDDPTTALGGGQIKIHTGGGGGGNPHVVAGGGEEVPDAFALYGSYPNPFNPATTLRYDVPESAQVRLVVFDVLGRQIRVLVDGMREAGAHEIVFDASDLPSGTYLYRLETPQGSFVQTMLLVK